MNGERRPTKAQHIASSSAGWLSVDQIAQVANGLNDGFLHRFVCLSLLQKVSRIKRLAQEFGPDRMIYGGFSSEATGTTYRAAREQARSLVSFLSVADQAKVFGENAARLFGLKRS
jgi:predicted TIM-barrel fold metal-dependent hydrolase